MAENKIYIIGEDDKQKVLHVLDMIWQHLGLDYDDIPEKHQNVKVNVQEVRELMAEGYDLTDPEVVVILKYLYAEIGQEVKNNIEMDQFAENATLDDFKVMSEIDLDNL
jgi:hypothetical protein